MYSLPVACLVAEADGAVEKAEATFPFSVGEKAEPDVEGGERRFELPGSVTEANDAGGNEVDSASEVSLGRLRRDWKALGGPGRTENLSIERP